MVHISGASIALMLTSIQKIIQAKLTLTIEIHLIIRGLRYNYTGGSEAMDPTMQRPTGGSVHEVC
jgi:hypothetical protein